MAVSALLVGLKVNLTWNTNMKVVIAVKMWGQPNPYDEWLSRYEIPENQPKFLKI